jgi:Poly(ADP-ribose) polymerase catalytic domain
LWGRKFADNSSKSNQYNHVGGCKLSGFQSDLNQCQCSKAVPAQMIVCRVMLGDALVECNYRGNGVGQFWNGRRKEPENAATGGVWNSVVGECKRNYANAALNLREYAVYESSQVYPEYVLHYVRE